MMRLNPSAKRRAWALSVRTGLVCGILALNPLNLVYAQGQTQAPEPVPAQASPASPSQKLRIVGGLGGVNQFVRHEEPFWTKDLKRLSGGKYDADIVPFDRAGVAASDMLRLLQLGVVPFGTALLGIMSAQYPEFSAPDLAGLNPGMGELKKSAAAFRPYLEKTLRARHGIEVLALYVYPAQVAFCKKPIASLADLSGRRIRVSAVTQADFVTGLGAVPVSTPFNQLMANMASGNTDCAITGTMSGNTLGLHEVTSHVHTLPINWGLAVFGANQKAWEALPPDLRALLRRELPKLESDIWVESERETSEGTACNTGATACANGRRGKMLEVPTSAQDERLRQEILASVVIPRWLQRCGSQCAEVWNQTVGPARGILAPAAK